MIRLFCGPKGTGKTKIILDEIDRSVDVAKGDIVFITDKKQDSTNRINFNVRVIYTEEFDIHGEKAFGGFIKGLMAGNSDIEYLFIDGLARIVGTDNDDIANFLNVIKRLEGEYGFNATITVSKLKEEFSEQDRAFVEQ